MAKEIATKTKLDTRIAADIAAAMPVANQPAAVKAAAAPALAKKAIVIDTEEVQAAVEQAVEGSADVIVAQAAAASTGAAAGGAAAAGMSTTALVVAGVAVAAAAGGGSSSSSSPAAVTPTPSTPAATPAPASLSVTITSVEDKQDYSASTSNITMTVDGNDDATDGDELVIKTGSGNDTVVLKTYLTADIDAGAGNDTLDLRDLNIEDVDTAGEASVNLQTGVADVDMHATFKNFENVIANSDFGGRLVGTSGANTITLGEEDDEVSAAGGDDTILADGDTLTTGDDLDGGSGTDTLVIDGENTLDLGALAGVSGIENIRITGTTDDDVTLTLDDLLNVDPTTTSATTALVNGIRNVNIADKGGDNTVAITTTDDANLIGVTFTNVQTLDISAGDNDIRIDTNSLTGIETLIGAADDKLTLRGGTYDLSKVQFDTLVEISGSAASADTVQLGARYGDLTDIDLGASTGDVVTFKGTDVGDLTALTTFDGVESVAFGSATSVAMSDSQAADVSTIEGTAGTNDTLTFDGDTVDGTLLTIKGVENVVIDAAGDPITLTLGETTFEKGVTVYGDSDSDTVVVGQSGVDLTTATFRDFETISTDTFETSVSVANLSSFKFIDGDAAGKYVLTDSGELTINTDVANGGAATGNFTISGFTGDDTWTISAFDDGANAVVFNTGAGNDKIIANGGASSLNVLGDSLFKLGLGDDTFQTNAIEEFDTGVVVVDAGQGTDTLLTSDKAIAAGDILAADWVGFEKLSYASAQTADISLALGANDIGKAGSLVVDFSADTSASGANTFDFSAAGTASLTFTGSAGEDTIDTTTKTFTGKAGAGDDTFNVTGLALADASSTKYTYTLTGDAGNDEYVVAAAVFTDGKGFHSVVITDFAPGKDTLDISAISAGADEVKQSVAQAIVDAANPSTLGAALNALSTNADDLNADRVYVFQYGGDTYVFADLDQGAAAYSSTADYYVKLSGAVTISSSGTDNLVGIIA